ncbi:UDP-glucose 4-epimerase family protein [Hydrogenophaga sp. NFH-34]|uniref:UDP-glucose 4-epimerase family protein n=1 Tax=Hydrogenophaga sp. NFH-34 TaxID=2744446 RepID=UPI001F4629D8|nr:SDR family oxidoreductase [Hydrogenophaga sp. NFH-34]
MLAVTGATGFVGRALLGRLVRDGRPVRALTRSGPSAPGRVCIGDIGPDTDWRAALAGVRCVVHCAARVHVMADRHPDPLAAYRAVNTAGTERLARQAAQAGVRRLVLVSTVKVLGERSLPGRPLSANSPAQPEDPYGQSKHEAEQALWAVARESGLEVVVVRPPLVYGPGVGANFRALMRWVAQGRPLPLGAIRNQRSLVGIHNLVDLLVRCTDHPQAPGRAWLVSDGHDLSTPDLVRAMAAATGRPARLWPVPVPALQLAGRLTGRAAAVARLTESLQVDISDTVRQLDWRPPYPVDIELARTAEALA